MTTAFSSTGSTRRDVASKVSAVVAVVAAVAGLLSLVAWSELRESRALLRMSPPLRERVYRGALANLQELCPASTRSAALEQECRRQAHFVTQFPECDEACRAWVRLHFPQPAR